MAILQLKPSGHKSGDSSLIQGGLVIEAGGGTDPDYTILSGGAGSTHYLFNSAGNTGSGYAVGARSEVFNLAVSGTDIPSGRTIISYRTVISGFDHNGNTLKKLSVAVAASENSKVLISSAGTKQSLMSGWMKTVNGATPSKANLIAAGLQVSYPANPNVFSLWQAYVEVQYNDIPLTISTSKVIPAPGSVVTTDLPTLSAEIQQVASYTLQKCVWTFATDVGFTANVQVYTEPDSMLRVSGSMSSVLPEGLKLSTGEWFVKVHGVDQYGLVGPDSAVFAVTVSHPSSAIPLSPSGVGVNWNGGVLTFYWQFSDSALPEDHQTAYQVQVYTSNNADLVADTGKVASGDSSVTLTLDPAFQNAQLSWRVMVYDEGDEAAGWSEFIPFTPSAPPTVTVTDATTLSPAPQVQWDFESTASSEQTIYLVELHDTDNGRSLYSSGWVAGSDAEYTVNTPAVSNLENVTVRVTVQDSLGFIVYGELDYTAEWAQPDQPTQYVDTSKFGLEGFAYNKITWDNSVEDPQFNSYQIWRKLTEDTKWTVVGEIITPAATYEYHDYLSPANLSVDYAVVQTAIRYGFGPAAAVPSPAVPTTVTPVSDNYFLIDPTDNTNNMLMPHVTSDSFTDQVESEVLQLIGRGQKSDTGTHWGITGSLTAVVYGTSLLTARQVRTRLLEFARNGKDLFLRNPFGDVIRIDVGNIQCDRMAGVGSSDYFTAQLPYNEVV